MHVPDENILWGVGKGLKLALIALVVVGAATQLGATINSVFWQPIAQSF